MEKSTIEMVIVHSYVKLPEGKPRVKPQFSVVIPQLFILLLGLHFFKPPTFWRFSPGKTIMCYHSLWLFIRHV